MRTRVHSTRIDAINAMPEWVPNDVTKVRTPPTSPPPYPAPLIDRLLSPPTLSTLSRELVADFRTHHRQPAGQGGRGLARAARLRHTPVHHTGRRGLRPSQD